MLLCVERLEDGAGDRRRLPEGDKMVRVEDPDIFQIVGRPLPFVLGHKLVVSTK